MVKEPSCLLILSTIKTRPNGNVTTVALSPLCALFRTWCNVSFYRQNSVKTLLTFQVNYFSFLKTSSPSNTGNSNRAKVPSSLKGKLLCSESVCDRSMVAHWYAICFVPGGPGFKSQQGRELLILNKKELLI